jgi:hypothetical protein
LQNDKKRDHLEDTDLDGRVLLKWNLKNRVERGGFYSSGLG